MRRLWRTIKAVRRLLTYPAGLPEWTDGDGKALRAFLNHTSTGHKLRNIFATQILNESQRIVGEGAPEHECGVITGMRFMLASMEAYASAGVAPEEDQSYE